MGVSGAGQRGVGGGGAGRVPIRLSWESGLEFLGSDLGQGPWPL